MKTDLNSNIHGKLDKRSNIKKKKRTNTKRIFLALNLVAVIFTTTVFSNPVSVMSEEVSADAVQSIENSAGGNEQIAEQADAQQNTAEEAQAAETPAAENSAEAAKAEEPSDVNAPAENTLPVETGAAEDGVVLSDGGAATASAPQSGDAASVAGALIRGAGAGNTDGVQDGIIEDGAEGLNEAERSVSNKTPEAAASQQQLTYEDDHVKIDASCTDGRTFPADLMLTGTYLDSGAKDAVRNAVNAQISKDNATNTVSDPAEHAESSGGAAAASTTTTVEYSVAGLHALKLAVKNQDGSDAVAEGELSFSAEFKNGLNDAGYASREEINENHEAAGDGTLINTTTRFETSWKIYTVTEKDVTEITNAHGTHSDVDENGTLKSASFRGELPQTVAFIQIVKRTVTETTTQKETEKDTEKETQKTTDKDTEKITEKITETETETENEKEDVPESAEMPAVTFDQKVTTDNGTVMVHVDAEEGTVEDGTTMTVTPVTSQDILDKAIDAAGGKGAAAAMDITFTSPDGIKTEPLKPIHVKMISPVLNRAEEAHVVHVADSGSTDVVAKKSDGRTVESTSSDAASSDAKNTVSFESDSFSVYAIVYTVDFTFSSYTYSIQGGSSILLSSLAEKLGLHDSKQNKDFSIADVDDVTFSDSSLVKVTKKDGDWELASKKPFTSTEKLTISMKDGSRYEVKVKDAQEVDFSKYITSVDTYKKNNGNWEKTSSIQDGDNVKFQLNFSVNSEELSQGQKLTYTMDNHITIGQATSGSLYQGTTPVGTVNVDTNGKVTISLNDSFDPAKAFEGNVKFEGTVHNSGSSKPITVNFGEKAAISINPKSTSNNYDVSTAKTGSYQTDSNGKHYIQYEVTISTTKGTGGALSFTDSMSANGIKVPTYDKNQVWVYKNGTSYSVSGVSPYINSEGKLEIDNLPELDANENYHVIYCVPVNGEITSTDGSASVNNNCHVWNSNVNGWGGTTTKIQDAVIQKTGYYDANSGKLKWTITVNNPDHKNLSGTVLKDVLNVTDGDGTNVKLPENFTIKDSDGREVTGSFDADGNYTFPSGSYIADKYTIEYETSAPAGTAGTTSKVKNSITYQEGGKEYRTDSGDINVYHPTYGVQKWFSESEGQTDDGEKLQWTARVDLPDGELNLTKLIYTDTMTAWNKTGELTGKHFITPALLNKATLWSDAGTLVAGTDYKLQKLDGTDITGSTSTDKLSGFKIQFLDAAITKLKGQKCFSLRYSTIADETEQPAGSTWTFKNKASIPDHESEVSYNYKKPDGDLVKQVSLTGETTSYSSDAPVIEYSEKGMTLYYKVLIRLNKNSYGDQTIVDVLPSGMNFGELKRVVYFDDIWNQYDDLNHYTGGSSFNLKDHVTVNSEQQADGATKTTFTLSDGYERNSDSYCIAFYYNATISDAQFWSNLHNAEKEYTNEVVWGNLNTDVTTKVRHTIKNLDKIAQLSDVEGTNGEIKKAAYYLTINPLGSDLVPGADTITLKDQISCDKADVEMHFQPESLKVFAYDGLKQNHCGDEMNQNRYGFSYDEQQHSMELKLPDETPCVVYYEYYVVPGMNKAGLSNAASLSGVVNSSTENKLSLSESTASGSVIRDELYIYKVDSDNYRIKLQGVNFDLYQYQYNNNTPSWTKVDPMKMKDPLTTDQDGKLYLNRIDDNLAQDCLYKLVETSVGKNTTYQLDANKGYYFIWASKNDESKNDQQIWNAISGYDHSDAKQEEVNIIRNSGTIYVPNENTGITINKIWLNADHTDDKNPGIATVTLYQQAKQPGGVKVNVQVENASSNNRIVYQEEVYIQKGTLVSLLIDTHWEETYLVDGYTTQFHDGGDHTLQLGSPQKDTTYTVSASYWDTQKVKELYYTPTDQFTDIGEKKIVGTYELTKDKNYSQTIGNLPLKDSNDNKYYYWVKESKVPHYITSCSDNNGKIQKGTITVTNTRESVTVSGTKAWKNVDGSSNPPAGASCVFELYKNGTATGNRITLDGIADDRETSAWTAVFTNLEKYDASGTEIHYAVREVQSPEGYVADETEIENGGTITNSQEQQLEFTKIWSDGNKNISWPSGITIKVLLHRELRDDQNMALTDPKLVTTYVLDGNRVVIKNPENAPDCTPSEKDGMYTYLIPGLPSTGTGMKDGKIISGTWHYYITEEKVNGYQRPKYRVLNKDGTVVIGKELNYAENGQAIINQKESSYELPSTGGPGTLPWTASGILLVFLAGVVFMVRILLIYRSRGKGGGLRS